MEIQLQRRNQSIKTNMQSQAPPTQQRGWGRRIPSCLELWGVAGRLGLYSLFPYCTHSTEVKWQACLHSPATNSDSHSYGLDLKYPQKALLLRWVLVRGAGSLKQTWKGVSLPLVLLCPSLSWPPWYEQISFNVSFHYIVSSLEPIDQGLNPLKLWAKQTSPLLNFGYQIFCLSNRKDN